MITCKSGVTIRMPVGGISEQGRATQGVKLIRLDEGDEIAAITKLDDEQPIIDAVVATDVVITEIPAVGPGEQAADEKPDATNDSQTPSEESE
jgi:DNA gyrase subunit A